MQNDHTTAAILGLLAGAVPGAQNYFRNLESDLKAAENAAKKSAVDVRSSQLRLDRLLASGSYLRSLYPTVMDFEAGLASGVYKKSPGGVLVLHQGGSCPRPDPVTEDEIEDLKYPPRTSEYDQRLFLNDNEEAGQLLKLGRALTMQEVQAAIVALQQEEAPKAAGLVQIHRLMNQLVARAVELNYSPAQYKEVWDSLLPLPGYGSSGSSATAFARLIDIITTDSANITNTTTETAFDRFLTIPANTVPVGRCLKISFGIYCPTANSTDTLAVKVKLSNTSGTALFTGSAVDIGNSGAFVNVELTLIRRADSTVAKGLCYGKAITDTGAVASGMTEASIDFTSQLVIVPTATWSVASATNIARVIGGTAVLQ